MFRALGELLPGALQRLKVQRPVEAAVICSAVTEVLGSMWDHAVPMRAVSYRSGVVTVAVTSAAWAHEVSMRSQAVQETVNRKLGGHPVGRLKTRVSPAAARGEQPL